MLYCEDGTTLIINFSRAQTLGSCLNFRKSCFLDASTHQRLMRHTDTNRTLTLKFPFIGHDWWLGWCLHAFFGCREQKHKNALEEVDSKSFKIWYEEASWFSHVEKWERNKVDNLVPGLGLFFVSEVLSSLDFDIVMSLWTGIYKKAGGGTGDT